jgi:multimeric flavodoxin WrbA
MNILVLNGSPRQNGNTAKMVTAFCEGAESSRHTVKTVNVCKLNVKGCLACEYCHSKGNGKCIQKDDMQDIYSLLKDTNMLVLASPIYYHGISGQLKCVIDRFYSALYPAAPKSLTQGNTAQSPPDGLAAHLLASFPSSCTEIPCWASAQRRHFYTI